LSLDRFLLKQFYAPARRDSTLNLSDISHLDKRAA